MRNLQKIESDFTLALNNLDDASEQSVLLCLLRSVTDEELYHMISATKNDSSQLLASSKFSYSHANGFDKVVLISNKIFGLRLHAWWNLDGFAESNSDIHNHRWNFATRILHGTYNSEIYAFSTTEKIYDHYSYHHDGDEFFLEKRENIGISLVSCELVSEDQSYSQIYSTLHQIKTAAVPVVTLFLHGKKLISHTSVCRQSFDKNYEQVNSLNYLSPLRLSIKLEQIQQLLKSKF